MLMLLRLIYILALRDCYEKHHVIHRDISSNNLMFKEDSGDKNSIREGVLIDFDHAIDTRSLSAVRERAVSFNRPGLPIAYFSSAQGHSSIYGLRALAVMDSGKVCTTIQSKAHSCSSYI